LGRSRLAISHLALSGHSDDCLDSRLVWARNRAGAMLRVRAESAA
jgi:hypothetical protein